MPPVHSINRATHRSHGPSVTRSPLIYAFTLLMVCITGCAATRETTKSPRSPIEQLLLTQSLRRGLAEASLPLNPKNTVFIETIGLTADQAFAQAVVTSWVGQQGLHVRATREEARYHMKVQLHAFGTELEKTFFGLPPITSVLIPFSLPEITLYGIIKQLGYAQFSFDIIDSKNGQLLRSTPTFEGHSSITSYTFLIFFTFRTSDLTPPPP